MPKVLSQRPTGGYCVDYGVGELVVNKQPSLGDCIGRVWEMYTMGDYFGSFLTVKTKYLSESS